MPEHNNEEIPSPCRHNCMLNSDRLCIGCFRTNDEIDVWWTADRATKLQILAKLKERRSNRFK